MQLILESVCSADIGQICYRLQTFLGNKQLYMYKAWSVTEILLCLLYATCIYATCPVIWIIWTACQKNRNHLNSSWRACKWGRTLKLCEHPFSILNDHVLSTPRRPFALWSGKWLTSHPQWSVCASFQHLKQKQRVKWITPIDNKFHT
jgi:hypothetical protein